MAENYWLFVLIISIFFDLFKINLGMVIICNLHIEL